MIVWCDGEYLTEEDARPGFGDRGFLLGDGLFETARIQGGVVKRADAHARRLEHSRKLAGLEAGINPLDIGAVGKQLAARNEITSGVLRVTVTRGLGARGLAVTGDEMPVSWMSVGPLAEAPERVSLHTSQVRREPTAFSCRHKTLSYMDNIAARAEAKRNGADMALMLTGAGKISCVDSANIFWMRKGKLETPSMRCGILPGTVRSALIRSLPIKEGEFTPDVLQEADFVFITNALIGATGVKRVDEHALKDAGPALAALSKALG